MLIIESRAAVGFSYRNYNPAVPTSSCSLFHSKTTCFFTPWYRFGRLATQNCNQRKNISKNVVRVFAEEPRYGASSPIKRNGKSSEYHPSEDIEESKPIEGQDAWLTPAESCRTIIEVNSKATLMFSNLVSDEVHENVFLPDLPYVTDEHGSIYIQVKNDQDILQTLTDDDNLVQVIIGLDTAENCSVRWKH